MILLMAIHDDSINDYWFLLMDFHDYSINDYWCLFD
jgi:hypothetical protein